MADQPLAGSSSSRNQQLATFIFDPLLPRSRYTELIQLDGVVHCLTKRLLEKHQNDSYLRVEAIIPSALPCTAGKRSRSRERRTGFQNATGFMRSLSPLKGYLNESAACLAGDRVVWPAFGSAEGGGQGSKKRKRRAEVGLLDGVVSGLEGIHNVSQSNPSVAPPDLINSLCPADARPLLTALYTPPSSPPTGIITKYLFIFAYDGGSSSDEVDLEESRWDELAARCGDDGVKVSLVVSASGHGEGPVTKRLKDLFHKVSPSPAISSWFSLPQNTSTQLSGLSLPSITFPFPQAPPTNRSSPSIATATPLTSVDSPSQPALNQHQALAMRFLAQRSAATGGQLPGGLSNPAVSAALANFMAAARAGNVDPNDPQMAQFKQMIMMQQQMAGKDGDQAKQKMMQALQAAQAAQQQQANKAQPAASGSGGPSITKGKVWSGEIVWPVQNANTGEARLNVECTTASNGSLSDPSQISSVLPKELRIVSSMQADSTFLQGFVRENRVPVLQFELSSDGPADPASTKRFESLINGLNSKGTVGVVHIGSTERGILLCTAPGGQGQIPRLLGVMCLTVPLPSPPPRPQGPTPTSSSANLRRPSDAQSQQSSAMDLPAPYKPPQQYPNPPNPTNNPAQPNIPNISATTDQLRALLVQAARLGVELPQDLDPAKLTQIQIRGLLQSIKMKNMQRQHLMLQQQQQAGGMNGIDPRLMPGGGIDPRLMGGSDGSGNQLGLQQMQMQMQNAIGQSGVDQAGQGFMGGYQGGQG